MEMHPDELLITLGEEVAKRARADRLLAMAQHQLRQYAEKFGPLTPPDGGEPAEAPESNVVALEEKYGKLGNVTALPKKKKAD